LPLRQRWNITLPGAIVEPPISAHGTVFVTSTSGLYKLDLESGKILWQIRVEKSHKPSLAYYNGQLYYATSTNSDLYQIDSESGRHQWLLKTNSVHDNLCFYKDRIFLKYQKTINSKEIEGIAKFNFDMQEEWFHPSDEHLSMSICVASNDSLVYVDNAGKVYCIDVNTGKELWKTKILNLIPPFPHSINKGGWVDTDVPVIIGKTVVIKVNRPIHGLGLDLVSGKILWIYNKYQNPESIAAWGLGLDDQYWYYLSINQSKQLEYVKLEIHTGEEEQVVNLSDFKKEIGTSYARTGLVVGHHHFIGTYHPPQIVAFNTVTGIPEWVSPIRQYPLAIGNNSGIYADDKLIWGTVGGDLYCFE
jgi:outer membrane protein assembly factor BamB